MRLRLFAFALAAALCLASAPGFAFTAPSDVYVPPATTPQSQPSAPSAGQSSAAPQPIATPDAPRRLMGRKQYKPLPATTPPPKGKSVSKSAKGKKTNKASKGVKSARASKITNDILNHIADTRVVKMDNSLPQRKTRLAQSITASVGGSLSWGSSDGQDVAKHLNIPYAKVPQLCTFTFNGSISADKGSFAFVLNPNTPSMPVDYNGNIQHVRAEVFASCPATQNLPAHAGTIYQSGNQYLVSLGEIACPAPPQGPAPSQVSIVYSGNQKGSCIYQ